MLYMTDLCLNAPQTTEFFITRLLPFGYETASRATLSMAQRSERCPSSLCICVSLLQKPVIELLADSFALVIQFIDVS